MLIVLYLLAGETLNLMTLGGLALAVGIPHDATADREHRAPGWPSAELPPGHPHGACEIGRRNRPPVSTLCICIVSMFFLG